MSKLDDKKNALLEFLHMFGKDVEKAKGEADAFLSNLISKTFEK